MAKKLYEESSVQAIANAIRAKNGETTTYKLGEMAAAIQAIATGGSGESWTDSYTVFATGTFTPAEALTEYSIDTGVPFDCSGSNYLRQMLMIWREPDLKTISGLYVCVIRTSSSSADGTNTAHGAAVGFAQEVNVSRAITSSNHSFPNQGETVWDITVNASTKFVAGKPYRWMLLGALE